MASLEELAAVGALGVVGELEVSLVEDHGHRRRHCVEKGRDFVAAHECAGGVVRVADPDEAGVRGHRRGHRLEVQAQVAHGHVHEARVHQRTEGFSGERSQSTTG